MTDATAPGDRVILVTGAGSGIGAAAAVLLARSGAHLGLLDLDGTAAQQTADRIRAAGGSAEAMAADIADDAAMRHAVRGLGHRRGRLDGVVAAAGINGVWAPVDDLRADEFDRTVAVNLRGTFVTLHHAVPFLRRAGGAIVIVASINGTRTFSSPGALAYAAAKAGQLAMGRQLALELARDGIRVNTLCPGWTRTGIGRSTAARNQQLARFPVDHPLGRVPLTGGAPAEPDAMAGAIGFLMSEAAGHISGAELFVDGAESLVT